MPIHLRLPTVVLLLACVIPFGLAVAKPTLGVSPIQWQEFGPAAFDEARRSNKLVLLDLVAVWCHWCHVMEDKTYGNAEVAAFIERHFVPVKADHDARPDLAERYRDWGWPATVVLNADGEDVLKRAGYIDPESMRRMLGTVRDDPSPEIDNRSVLPASAATTVTLASDLQAGLVERHQRTYDETHAGLAMMMKFLDGDAALWSLRQAGSGNRAEESRLRRTLDANLALIDPAFGGVYQYSTHGDWAHPHYEKIMRSHWVNLVTYSEACRQLNEPRYCRAGEDVAAFLFDFLQAPSGAFYTSQDADLVPGQKAHDYFALGREARLERGLPRIDKALYASTNGMAIEGLAALYLATGNNRYFDAALRAAEWVIEHRRLWGGGFRHAQVDSAGPYLADTLHMGRAFLSLYKASQDDQWLNRSLDASRFISRQLRHPVAGLAASVADGTPVKPLPQIDQNIQAALWLAELAAISGRSEPAELGGFVMRYLGTSEIAFSRLTDAGILEANERFKPLLANH